MLPSLDRIFAHPTLEDTGLPQQAEIFEDVRRRTGVTPPVVDARTLLESPEGVLRALCDALELPFSASMLSWPPGPRATDGVWAKHWYGSVERTTGFEPYRPKTEPLPAHLEGLLAECNEYYQLLYAHRLRA
jgi:hypothetical protein